jgi:hypothetical protein
MTTMLDQAPAPAPREPAATEDYWARMQALRDELAALRPERSGR